MNYDPVIEDFYEVRKIGAKDFATQLKQTYNDLGINIEECNSLLNQKQKTDPPIESYFYQLFFAYENENGQLLLLDGYRRLLWADEVPDVEIKVNVYKELKNKQLIELMVGLNHWKFHSSGKNFFWDRGFALFYKTFFDIDLISISDAYMGYLLVDKTKAEYDFHLRYSYDEKANTRIKEKMHEPKYIDNLKFIQQGVKTWTGLNNVQIGSLIYKFKDSEMDENSFQDFLNSKEVKKVCEGLENMSSSGLIKRMNMFADLFKEYIYSLKGIELVTYASAVEQCKAIERDLKKNGWKSFSSFLKNTHYTDKLSFIDKAEHDLICVVYPDEKTFSESQQYGVFKNIEFRKFQNNHGNWSFNLFLDDVEFKTGFRNRNRTYPMKKVLFDGSIRKVKTYQGLKSRWF